MSKLEFSPRSKCLPHLNVFSRLREICERIILVPYLTEWMCWEKYSQTWRLRKHCVFCTTWNRAARLRSIFMGVLTVEGGWIAQIRSAGPNLVHLLLFSWTRQQPRLDCHHFLWPWVFALSEEKIVFYCYGPSRDLHLIGYKSANNIEVTDDCKVKVRVYAQSKICIPTTRYQRLQTRWLG